MADEPHVIRGIDWKTTFPFVNLFRGFRVAIHPSKLILALMALILILVGGKVLDTVWAHHDRAVPNEMELYAASMASPTSAYPLTSPTASADFKAAREQAWKNLDDAKAAKLEEFKKPKGGDLGDIKAGIKYDRDQAVKLARDNFDKSAKDHAAAQARDAAISEAYAGAAGEWQQDQKLDGVGLFDTFYDNEVNALNGMVGAVRMGNWGGVVDSIESFFVFAPTWAIKYHPLFFTLFIIYFLCIWSIFGGAISRIAAVHVGREEKISIRQALRFSTAKFLSFFSAPIIPLLIVFAVGLLIAVGGLLLNIPWLGPILIGVLFFLALAGGFVMTLVVIGLAGGLNLMYPTIAVEGSDSFDAISRSFSYLYARPWRLGFYTAVSVVYGSLCYLFVHFFVYLLLALTHWFVGLLAFYHAENTVLLWNMIWPMPTGGSDLTYDISYLSLGSGDATGAFLVSLWVYLVIGLLGAFAISFYFSINTIIYYLMRHEVDATELDDVYLEQSDDDFAETLPAGATTVEVTTTTVTVPVGTSSTSVASPQAAAPDIAPNATTESPSENPPA